MGVEVVPDQDDRRLELDVGLAQQIDVVGLGQALRFAFTSGNASYGALPYLRKLDSYTRQNILAASLSPATHSNFSRFKQFLAEHQLASLLRPYPHGFDKAAIETRQDLYRRLCEIVWNPQRLGLTVPEPAVAARKPTKRAGQKLPPLAPLVEVGVVAANELLTGTRRKEEYTAKVLADGRVEVATGEVFADPAVAGAWVLGTKTCRGWEFWHVIRAGAHVPLKEIRADAAK